MTGRLDPRTPNIGKSDVTQAAGATAQPVAAGRSPSLLAIMSQHAALQNEDQSKPANLAALRKFEQEHPFELAKLEELRRSHFGKPMARSAPALPATPAPVPAPRNPIHLPHPPAPSTSEWNRGGGGNGQIGDAQTLNPAKVTPARTNTGEAIRTSPSGQGPGDEFMQIFGEMREVLQNLPKLYRDRVDASRNKGTIKEYSQRFKTRFLERGSFALPSKGRANRSRLLTVALVHLVPSGNALIDEISYLIETGAHDLAYRMYDRISDWLVQFKQLDGSWQNPRRPVDDDPKEMPRPSGKLPSSWEYDIERAARRRPIWHLAICVVLSTGVREADMSVAPRDNGAGVRPVKIHPTDRPDELAFVIYGAKQGDARGDVGVGERTVVVKNDAPWTQALWKALGDEPELIIKPGAYGQLWGVVRELSLDCFPDLRPCINPKFLRNRFASALKQSLLSTTDRMIAMGHASFETYSDYGLSDDVPVATVGAVVRVSCDRPPNCFDE